MWIRRDGPLSAAAVRKRIFLTVTGVHCALILLFAVYSKVFAPKISHQTIAVHTVQQAPPALKTTTPPPKAAGVKKIAAAPVAKEKKKPPPAFRENEKKKTTAPPKRGKEEKSLPEFEMNIPQMLEIKEESVAVVVEKTDLSYGDCLTQMLQRMLQLPEIGDVRARLSVSCKGEIRAIEILDSKSRKNSEWLKKELPSLSLPEFCQFGILDPVLDFTITFHNAENF